MVPRVLDGSGSTGRQQYRDVLVLIRELVATDLLSHVEVPEHTSPSDDRDAEKGMHRRVVRWKPVGAGVGSEIWQPNRLGLLDDQAKDAVPVRRSANPAPQLGVDPMRYEALQAFSVRADHSDGGVARLDHLGGHLHDAL